MSRPASVPRRLPALLFTAAALAAALLVTGEATSTTEVAYPDVITLKTDRGPSQVAIADLNLDGNLDVVSANAVSSTVSVLLGRGEGAFAEATHHPALEAKPFGLAVGRFDDDRYPDVVVSAAASPSLVLLLGDGHGSFAAPVAVPTGKASLAIAAGDLDGDGRDDVAVAHPAAEEIALYLNRGEGRLAPAGALLGEAKALLIADLDGDGKQDLAAASESEGMVAVFLNRGGASFAPAAAYPAGAGTRSLEVADFNADGAPDLVAAGLDSDSLALLANRGDGTFSPAGQLGVRQPTAVAATDVDGDGRTDLVAAELPNSSIAVLLNRGDGFAPAVRFPLKGERVSSLAIGDVNRDGTPDVVSANMASDSVSVFLRGIRVPRIEKFTPTSTARVHLSRGNLEGPIEARFNTPLDPRSLGGGAVSLYAAQSGYHQAALLYDEAARTLTVVPHRAPAAGGEAMQAPGHVVDFRPGEPVTLSFTRGIRSRLGVPMEGSAIFSFTVEARQGSGQFVEAGRVDCVKIPGTLKAADMDNDGHVDIVALCREVDGIRVHFNAGGANFPHHESVFLPTKGYGPWDLVPADLNRDGKIDIAVVNTFSSDLTIIYNEGDRKFSEPINLASGAGPMSLTTGDFNGDGHLDIVTVTKGFPAALVFLNDGQGGFADPVSYHVAPSPYDITARDLDGDGDQDLVMTNLESDRGTILMNNGDGTFRRGEEFPLLLAKALVEEPVDVDGDGGVDIVTVNTASDDISIFLNRGAEKYEQQANVPVGLTPTDKVFGDFDGDGFVDMAITLDGGKVTLLLNNGDGTFRRAETLAVGKNPTSPVSADFNGDGTLDLVVANQYSFDLSVLLNQPRKESAAGGSK